MRDLGHPGLGLKGSSGLGWVSASGSFDCVSRKGATYFAQDDGLVGGEAETPGHAMKLRGLGHPLPFGDLVRSGFGLGGGAEEEPGAGEGEEEVGGPGGEGGGELVDVAHGFKEAELTPR